MPAMEPFSPSKPVQTFASCGLFPATALASPCSYSTCSHLSSAEHIKDPQPKYLSLGLSPTFSFPSPSIIPFTDPESEVRSENETSTITLRFHTHFLSSQITFSIFSFSNLSTSTLTYLFLFPCIAGHQMNFFLPLSPFFLWLFPLFCHCLWNLPEKSVFKTSIYLNTHIQSANENP